MDDQLLMVKTDVSERGGHSRNPLSIGSLLCDSARAHSAATSSFLISQREISTNPPLSLSEDLSSKLRALKLFCPLHGKKVWSK